jgi:hypothetical protein
VAADYGQEIKTALGEKARNGIVEKLQRGPGREIDRKMR